MREACENGSINSNFLAPGARVFSAAARQLAVAVSSVTRQMDALEAELGVQLLRRSTRTVILTDAGETYYAQATRILDDLDELHRSVGGLDATPRGLLRVTLPVAFGRLHVAPHIPSFLAQYPDLELDLLMSDAVSNLVEANVDLAVRIGAMDDPGLVARKLAPLRRVVCASPAYLEEHGTPTSPADLASHRCLTFAYGSRQKSWRFRRNGKVEEVRVRGPLHANNAEVLCTAAVQGVGLVLMATWLVSDAIRRKHLVAVLTDHEASPGAFDSDIHAMFPPSRRSSLKVRCFIEFFQKQFGSPPYWDAGWPSIKRPSPG